MNNEFLIKSEGEGYKYKHETLLNYALNRWGLNKAHSVGALSELIRKCSPNDVKDWENFYFAEGYQKKKNGLKITREFIKNLGELLFLKLSENVHQELASISEEECIDYVYNLVIRRTYDGYQTEIQTIYGQLEKILNLKIESASDELDRTYNVDFIINIKNSKIGLQIKPISGKTLNDYQWSEMHKHNHEKFFRDFGGKVFFIYSSKKGDKKEIVNKEIIEDIKLEIIRLND